jgi:hypothetical protein
MKKWSVRIEMGRTDEIRKIKGEGLKVRGTEETSRREGENMKGE